jgi:tRNA A37 methylthiotransferase MiaB
MTTPQKSVYVKTYGCQMNVYDSERMRDTLKAMGYAETPVPDGADLVIFNTLPYPRTCGRKSLFRTWPDQAPQEGQTG